MSERSTHIIEQETALAFDQQSRVFDDQYSVDAIIQYKRERVRSHVLKYLKPDSQILELNAGTGEDAIFFGDLGHRVHATDLSQGMQNMLSEKIKDSNLSNYVTHECCSYTSLKSITNKGPYDLIFSNFAGLNCTNEIEKVVASFDALLKPGGMATLVILPSFCLWETMLVFKGKFRTAFRRFFASEGRKANIDGNAFTCWYHSPKKIKSLFKKEYRLLNMEGLCIIVPPSYIENFATKFPRLFSFLCRQENNLKYRWPWRSIGDYYIISFKKDN